MKLKSLSLVLALCVTICPVLAGTARAHEVEIVRVDGTAEVRSADGKPGPAVKVGTRVPPGGTISTGENGKVVVRLQNSGFAVLDRKSKLEVNRASNGALGVLRQVSGWIYYALSRTAHRDRQAQVQTSVAVLGIRGTRFLVVVLPDRNEVGMRKGTINVESPEGEFELNRADEKAEFDAYKAQGQAAVEKEQEDFRKYQESTKKEFSEFVREFTLGANRQAAFDGKKVREQALSAELLRDMEAAEFYGGEWLDKVND